MRNIKSLLFLASFLFAFAAQAQNVRITPLTTASFGTVTVGTSQTLEFDLDLSISFADTLRSLVQTSVPGDMWGTSPAPGFTLNPGTCVAVGGAATGTPLNLGVGCRFSVTYAPTTPGPATTDVIATTYGPGWWGILPLTATAVAAPVAAPASIPTLSEWGLIAMSAMMGLFGLAWMRRRS